MVDKAKAMLSPDSARDAEALAPVWQALVDSAESASESTVPESAASEPVEPPPPEPPEPPEPVPPAPEPPESSESSESPKAPRVPRTPETTGSLLDQLKEAFPGAELIAVDEDGAPMTGAGARGGRNESP